MPRVTISGSSIKRARLHPTGIVHDALGLGLRKAIYNYMHCLCVEDDVRRWFEHLPHKVPKPTVNLQRIGKALG